jgi:hypothetical protein
MFGVVGFELNRQITQEVIGSDSFGTFYIFTFGGFMALGVGLFAWLREKKENYRAGQVSMRKYDGSEHSVLLASLGSLIIFALFPFLAY